MIKKLSKKTEEESEITAEPEAETEIVKKARIESNSETKEEPEAERGKRWMKEYEEVRKRIEEFENEDTTMEIIIEMLDTIKQQDEVTRIDMVRVMESILYSEIASPLFDEDEARVRKDLLVWTYYEDEDKEEMRVLMMQFTEVIKSKAEEQERFQV